MSINTDLNVNPKSEVLSLESFNKLNLQDQINTDDQEVTLVLDELINNFDYLFTNLIGVSVAN